MKKRLFELIGLVIFVVLLAACGGEQEPLKYEACPCRSEMNLPADQQNPEISEGCYLVELGLNTPTPQMVYPACALTPTPTLPATSTPNPFRNLITVTATPANTMMLFQLTEEQARNLGRSEGAGCYIGPMNRPYLYTPEDAIPLTPTPCPTMGVDVVPLEEYQGENIEILVTPQQQPSSRPTLPATPTPGE